MDADNGMAHLVTFIHVQCLHASAPPCILVWMERFTMAGQARGGALGGAHQLMSTQHHALLLDIMTIKEIDTSVKNITIHTDAGAEETTYM
jgi:hypothetical protein